MKNRSILSSLLLWLAAASSAGAVTVAADDFILTLENQKAEIPFSVLLANDDFEPQDRLKVDLDSGPASGELFDDAAGYVYKPNHGFTGVDTFTYRLNGSRSSSNTATVRIHVSPLWAPVAGDWNGDGNLDVGVYKNASSPFFLLCLIAEDEDASCSRYPVESRFVGFLPLAGNWDGDADPADEVGLYDPATGRFHLLDLGSHQTLLPLTDFTVGKGGQGNLPLAGDWNGDGIDTVGLRLAATGELGLRDENTAGGFDYLFALTGSQPGWLPFAGDWYQDGTLGVGLYDPANRKSYLRDELTSGPAQWLGNLAQDVPILGMGNPAGEPRLFWFLFFHREPSLLIFYISSNSNVRPHLKSVIPIDPDGDG